MKQKAIFLDRDGTFIKTVYHPESEIIDTVSNKDEVELTYDMPEVLKKLKGLGYLLIVVSNQPRVGLKKLSKKAYEEIIAEVDRQLAEQGIKMDKEYYCLHHPFAELPEYRQKCECRKPGIKFFKDAESEFDIDLRKSWLIGDGVNDILAGKRAGTKTILIGNMLEGGYLEILQRELKGTQPDFVVKKPKEILDIIQS